ncbi:MAG: response regulator transcription factor [bacterium]|nr:response regulator transcription factor [bacterium]
MRILVVEDEEPIRNLIAINLEMVGYEVLTSEDGTKAMEVLEKEPVDLILLDVMLPGIDGFTLIEQINVEETPVIFLTAKENVFDRVKGLRLGADDYIVKPFEAVELIARIEATMRRYKKSSDILRFRNIQVFLNQRIVKLEGKQVSLTVKEFDLLLLFLQNKNIALSREQIIEKVWGFDYMGMTRTVDIHVQRIREKLDLKDHIKTVFKIGYRLEE